MKTKHFNKTIYETEQKIKTSFIILLVFLIGLYVGVAINYLQIEKDKKEIEKLKIELNDRNETIDIFLQKNNDLETILNNYTIEERREAR